MPLGTHILKKLPRMLSGTFRPADFVQGSREELDKLMEYIRFKFEDDAETLQSWEAENRNFPQSDSAEEYCESHPLHIPFLDVLFQGEKVDRAAEAQRLYPSENQAPTMKSTPSMIINNGQKRTTCDQSRASLESNVGLYFSYLSVFYFLYYLSHIGIGLSLDNLRDFCSREAEDSAYEGYVIREDHLEPIWDRDKRRSAEEAHS